MDKFSYKLLTSANEYKSAFEVRRQVFVDEQGISEYLVFDGHDEEALQMVVKDGERVIGIARLQFPADNQVKLERMALLKPFCNKGIGKRMVSFLNEELRNRQVEQVVLHAQYEVVAFYKSCGFTETGSPFWEAGLNHMRMQQRL
jgi:predicted GNAT family N-acyltransferase